MKHSLLYLCQVSLLLTSLSSDKVEKTPINIELSPVLNTFSNVLHLRITNLHNYILELGLNNKKNTHRCSLTCGSSLAAFHNMADLLSWGTLGNFVTHESSTRPCNYSLEKIIKAHKFLLIAGYVRNDRIECISKTINHSRNYLFESLTKKSCPWWYAPSTFNSHLDPHATKQWSPRLGHWLHLLSILALKKNFQRIFWFEGWYWRTCFFALLPSCVFPRSSQKQPITTLRASSATFHLAIT